MKIYLLVISKVAQSGHTDVVSSSGKLKGAQIHYFLKMAQSRPLFVYFRSFHIRIQLTNIQFEIEKA